jgi:hypothetical protein
MNDSGQPKIVISPEELRDPRIDEAIEQQRSYAPAPLAPPKTKRRLLYSSWFYLMIAGAVGAAAAWAIIEPHFGDMITFTGALQSVEPDQTPGLYYGLQSEIRGKIRVAGVDIFVMPEKTRILARGSKTRLSLRDLSIGQIVSVYGVPAPVKTDLLAAAIRVEPAGTPAVTEIDLARMQQSRLVFGFLLFPFVAGMVGLMVGGVEGIVCRTYSRAVWSSSLGLIIGVVGGTISFVVAGLVFGLLGQLSAGNDPTASSGAFLFQMFRRGLAWTIAGMAMGLGQGLAMRSGKLAFNGFIGGMVGGLLGGLVFDPINLLFLGADGISGAPLSRAIGLTVIGAAVGLMIGLTDMLTRDAWLKVIRGPLQGKEFSFNRTPMRLGSSPKNEIYLFKDPKVDPIHAEINKLRDAFEIADNNSSSGTLVNGQRIRRQRLTDGARVQIGDSEFAYFSREKKKAR